MTPLGRTRPSPSARAGPVADAAGQHEITVIGCHEWFEKKIPLEAYPEALVARDLWEYFRNKGFGPGDTWPRGVPCTPRLALGDLESCPPDTGLIMAR
jgi:hypothetical protein